MRCKFYFLEKETVFRNDYECASSVHIHRSVMNHEIESRDHKCCWIVQRFTW